MSDLTPITRNEHLLNGDDLEPKNRKEMFLKRIYDKTQSVPEPETREEYFLKKAGDASGDITIEQLNVTESGTYSEQGKAYSPVVVNVPSYLVKDVPNLPQAVASFDDAIVAPIIKLKADIEAVQSGSGDASPENVRPISGWDGANVGNCQPLQVMVPTSSLPMTLNGVILEHLGGGKYKVCGNMTAAQNIVFSVDFDSFSIYDGTDSTIAFNNTYASNNINFTFLNGNTTVENWVLNPINRVTTYTGMRGKTTNGFKLTIASNMYGSPIDFTFQVMLYGSTNSTTYPISWSDEAGTVYGGNFKLFKDGGKWYCTVNTTHAKELFDGSDDEVWTLSDSGSTHRFYYTLNDSYSPSGRYECLCNIGKYISSGNTEGGCFISTKNYFYIPDQTITTASDFKTWLESNNMEVVYELATPTTTTFEIDTEIATLLGNNNIFADTGDVTECRYITEII